MSELAVKRMTLAEFLRWEDGTDARYELLAGTPVAMAPPAPAHGFLAARLCARIEGALRSRRPCMVQVEAGGPRPAREHHRLRGGPSAPPSSAHPRAPARPAPAVCRAM